jgi:hypothetical protein
LENSEFNRFVENEKHKVKEKDLNNKIKLLEEILKNKEKDCEVIDEKQFKNRITKLEYEVTKEKNTRKKFEDEIKEIHDNFRKEVKILSNDLDQRIENNKKIFPTTKINETFEKETNEVGNEEEKLKEEKVLAQRKLKRKE